jgi:hypothetical protein
MFRSGNRPTDRADDRLARLWPALLVSAVLLPVGSTLADDTQPASPAPGAPQGGPAIPGATPANPGAGGGPPTAPGAVERQGPSEPQTPRGCPFHERPLNLIV